VHVGFCAGVWAPCCAGVWEPYCVGCGSPAAPGSGIPFRMPERANKRSASSSQKKTQSKL
jgi:hypothetical protein